MCNESHRVKGFSIRLWQLRIEGAQVAQQDEGEAPVSYAVRLPQQRRSREAWQRILNAGVEILALKGYEGFTIASVCERASVPPRAIYDRVDHKEALFLAVYEHAISKVDDDHYQVFEGLQLAETSPIDVLRILVARIADNFHRHEAFLRPVLLLSASHAEVYRRGQFYSSRLGERFVDALRVAEQGRDQRSSEEALQFCFVIVHSAVVMRTMYGPGYAAAGTSAEAFKVMLSDVVTHYYRGSSSGIEGP